MNVPIVAEFRTEIAWPISMTRNYAGNGPLNRNILDFAHYYLALE